MKLCVDRDLNCGRYLVLPSWQYLKSQIALCQAVYGERQNSKLSLYCTAHYAADSATVAPFVCKFFSYSHYLCALLPTVHCSTITHSIQQHAVGYQKLDWKQEEALFAVFNNTFWDWQNRIQKVSGSCE